jgi:hypothetical protein
MASRKDTPKAAPTAASTEAKKAVAPVQAFTGLKVPYNLGEWTFSGIGFTAGEPVAEYFIKGKKVVRKYASGHVTGTGDLREAKPEGLVYVCKRQCAHCQRPVDQCKCGQS